MRVCNTCGEEKELTEYHKDNSMNEGRKNKCKSCRNKTGIRHGVINNGKPRRERDRETKRAYAKSKAGVESRARYEKKYRNAHLCRLNTANAKKRGKLKILTACENCNSSDFVEAHHHDYNQPLNVAFLCRACHKHWHSQFDPINKEFGIFNPKE